MLLDSLRADILNEFARADVKIEIGHGFQSAELHGRFFELKKWRAHCSREFLLPVKFPNNPCGRVSMSTASLAAIAVISLACSRVQSMAPA